MRDPFLNQLDLLYPEVASRECQLLARMGQLGLPMKMTSGLRSLKDQANKFAQGRTIGGPRITNRKISAHNLGLAVDNCFQGKNPFPVAGAEPWLIYVNEAKKLGFECGGEWHNPVDYPHIQFLCGFSLDALCDVFSFNGIDKVWTFLDEKLNKQRGVEWATRLSKVEDFLEG